MIASNEHKYDEKPYHGGGVLMDGAGCHVAPTACRASTSFPQAVSSSFEHETVWGVPSAAVKVRSMQASFRTLTTLQATGGNHSELRAAEPEGHREGDKQAGAHAIKVTTRVGGNPSSPSSTFLFRQAIR